MIGDAKGDLDAAKNNGILSILSYLVKKINHGNGLLMRVLKSSQKACLQAVTKTNFFWSLGNLYRKSRPGWNKQLTFYFYLLIFFFYLINPLAPTPLPLYL